MRLCTRRMRCRMAASICSRRSSARRRPWRMSSDERTDSASCRRIWARRRRWRRLHRRRRRRRQKPSSNLLSFPTAATLSIPASFLSTTSSSALIISAPSSLASALLTVRDPPLASCRFFVCLQLQLLRLSSSASQGNVVATSCNVRSNTQHAISKLFTAVLRARALQAAAIKSPRVRMGAAAGVLLRVFHLLPIV